MYQTVFFCTVGTFLQLWLWQHHLAPQFNPPDEKTFTQACWSHHQIVIWTCLWISICQAQPNYLQIVSWQCCLRTWDALTTMTGYNFTIPPGVISKPANQWAHKEFLKPLLHSSAQSECQEDLITDQVTNNQQSTIELKVTWIELRFRKLHR